MRILPAVLTDDPLDLERKLRQAESFTDAVQVDIMDGLFVPSRSISASDLAAVPNRLALETHLMVKEPENYLEGFRRAGAQRIVFHYESTATPEAVVRLARSLGVKVGIAINPDTPLNALTGLVRLVDSVLFLTVHPGFYGKEFIPGVLGKVRLFRREYPGVETGVDGGIKEANLKVVRESGADYACVGSAIFLDSDPAARFRSLARLAEDD